MRNKKRMLAVGLVGLFLTLTLIPLQGAYAKDPVVQLKFANYFPPPAPQSKISEEFIAELEKRTGGTVKVQFFAGGSLLKAPAMFQGVLTGIADIGYSHVEYTPGRMPVTETVGLPLGYPSGWVSNQVANDFVDHFKPPEWKDVDLLYMNASTPNVFITKKPVRTLEDLKGLTIRAPGRIGETVKALGATPAPTPVMETYDAMSKGVIDGTYTPFETLKTFRFAEVAKYVTASWQVGNVYPFYLVMNKNSYKKLSPGQKKVFYELCGEFMERSALMWNGVDFDGLDFALQQKVEIIELSPEQVTRWQDATKPVLDDYVKKMASSGYSESEVKGWLSYIEDRIKYWTAKQIELHIKSPTGPKGMTP